MKHLFRFLGVKGDKWALDRIEIEHMLNVLRLKTGDRFEIFDGKGNFAEARLDLIFKRDVEFSIESERSVISKSPPFELAIGALKPSTYDDMLPPLVELGVTKVIIFGQDQVSKDRISDKVHDRFKRIVVAAAKQCKTLWLPEVFVVHTLDHILDDSTLPTIVLNPEATDHFMQVVSKYPTGVRCLIGGEKGFSQREMDLLKGFSHARLGSNILRAWTAAVAATAVFSAL